MKKRTSLQSRVGRPQLTGIRTAGQSRKRALKVAKRTSALPPVLGGFSRSKAPRGFSVLKGLRLFLS